MSDPRIEKIEQTLRRLLDFLDDFLPLANTHVADFLIDDCWSRLVPPHVQSQLLTLSEAQLAKLPSGEIYKLSSLVGNQGPQNTQGDTPNDETPLSSSRHGDIPLGNSHQGDSPCKVDKDFSHRQRTPWDRTRLPQWCNRDLESFIVEAQSLTLPYLGLLMDVHDLVQTWRTTRTEKVFVGEFMSEKKKHEVDIMAEVCAALASHCQTNTVIDIGSGRGYLSSHLCLMHGLSVLAVDSSTVNTHSAQTRSQRLEKHWSGLVRNAKNTNNDKGVNKATNNKSKTTKHKHTEKEDTSEGQTNKKGSAEGLTPHPDSTVQHLQTGGTSGVKTGESSGVKVDKDTEGRPCIDRTVSEDSVGVTSSGSKSRCVQITQFVTPDTDLRHLVRLHLPHRDHGPNQNVGSCGSANVTAVDRRDSVLLTGLHTCGNQNVGSCGSGNVTAGDRKDSVLLTGLHTCGNLASSMLEIFCARRGAGEAAVAVCNVGCCYHHLDEAYVQGPFEADVRPSHYGFPMSRFLVGHGVQLGRNARMLASQTPARMASNGLVSHKSLFYRALLQVMLRDLTGQVSDDWHVGKIYAKSHDFTDYAQRALKKLHLDDGGKWTHDFVEAYEARFAADQAHLTAFVQLRAALAPVIETFILLDRLLYLLHQEVVTEAHVVQMFDPVTSPRCYGLIAMRR